MIFPEREMTILDYNRVVRDLNGRSAEQLLAELAKSFTIAPSDQPVRPTSSLVRSTSMVRPRPRVASAVVVLKRLADAMRDSDPIEALILGSAVNNDGQTSGSFGTVFRSATTDARSRPRTSS